MADFEKKVSLIEVDVDTAQAKKDVEDLTLSIIDQQSAVKANADEIKSLEKANKSLQDEVKKGTKTQKEADKELEANSQSIKDLKLANASLKDGVKDLNKERASAVKATKLQSNSLDALRKKSVDLKKALNAQETATAGGRKEFKRLQKDLKGTNDNIKKLDQGAGDFKTTVGDYPQVLDQMSGGFAGVAKSIMGATRSALAFIATPIGAIIAAVGLALAPLISYLTTTQEGIDKVTAVTRPLMAVFEKMKGIVQELGGSVFKGLAQILNGDLKEGLNTLKNGWVEAGEAIEEAIETGIEAGSKLDAITKSIEKAEISLITRRAELNNQFAKSKEIAQDVTKSEQERLEAAKAAQAAQNELLFLEQSLLDQKIQRMELEHSLNDTSREDEKELAELVAQRTQFEADAAKKRTSARMLENTINKQIEAEREKAAEEEIARTESAAAEKAEVAAKLNDKLKELDEFRLDQKRATDLSMAESEIEHLEMLRDIDQEDFEARMDQLSEQEESLAENELLSAEEKALRQAEIDLGREEAQAEHRDRLNEIDAAKNEEELKIEKEKQDRRKAIVQAGQKAVQGIIEIASNIVEGRYRKRHAELDKQLANGQISEEEFARKKEELEKKKALAVWEIEKKAFIVNKIQGIATAGINTALGISNALGSMPPPASFVLAGITGALGAIQIGAIASKQPPEKPSFAEGGMVINGRSHAQGGESIHVGGNYVGEMEGGEGLFVTKRAATANLLDDYNTAAGGRSMFDNSSRFLQEGGSVETSGAGIGQEELLEAIAATPPPVVQVVSIMAGINAEAEAKEVGTI